MVALLVQRVLALSALFFLLSLVKLVKLVVLFGIMTACVVILVVLAMVGSRSPECQRGYEYVSTGGRRGYCLAIDAGGRSQ